MTRGTYFFLFWLIARVTYLIEKLHITINIWNKIPVTSFLQYKRPFYKHREFFFVFFVINGYKFVNIEKIK